MNINELAARVKQASLQLAATGGETKNDALRCVAEAISERRQDIIRANEEDLRRSRQENLAAPLLSRLKFDEEKIAETVDGLHSLVQLAEPVGKTQLSTELDVGLELYKVTCPIGVIGVIFESRPDALVQISSLCLKSGNGVLLKGGSEAKETNRILAEIIVQATTKAGIPKDWLYLMETRSEVSEMLSASEWIDLLIPRGSNEFVRYIMDNTKIPVMGHADGICHLYVDAGADLDMAVKLAVDSKTQYVAVCNATETLLVHQQIAGAFLPKLAAALAPKQVELIGCPQTAAILGGVTPASEADWGAEYLDYKLSVKIVPNLEEAIRHINQYGSGHTDSIVTADSRAASTFMSLVDSGNVYWNCSTRFSDGFRYGFGAEVGVSTSKIHSRGPVGLEGLLIYKYKLIGNGHIVADYSERIKTFKHNKLNRDFPYEQN